MAVQRGNAASIVGTLFSPSSFGGGGGGGGGIIIIYGYAVFSHILKKTTKKTLNPYEQVISCSCSTTAGEGFAKGCIGN